MKKIINLFGKFRSPFARYHDQRMRELRHCDFDAQPVQWFTGPETIIYLDEHNKPVRSITTY